MRPLRRGYTNRTLGDDVTVVKRHQGPGALDRSRHEHAVLSAVAGRVRYRRSWRPGTAV